MHAGPTRHAQAVAQRAPPDKPEKPGLRQRHLEPDHPRRELPIDPLGRTGHAQDLRDPRFRKPRRLELRAHFLRRQAVGPNQIREPKVQAPDRPAPALELPRQFAQTRQGPPVREPIPGRHREATGQLFEGGRRFREALPCTVKGGVCAPLRAGGGRSFALDWQGFGGHRTVRRGGVVVADVSIKRQGRAGCAGPGRSRGPAPGRPLPCPRDLALAFHGSHSTGIPKLAHAS